MPRIAAALVALVTLAACGSDGDEVAETARTRAAQARQVARDAGLSPAVQDLLADAAGAVGQTYTVAYRMGGEGTGRSIVVQDPPRRRIEFELVADGVSVSRLFVNNDDGSFACARVTGKWQCQRNREAQEGLGPLGLGDVQDATQDLLAAAEDYSFTTERRELVGVNARCLVTALKPGRTADAQRAPRAVFCVSPEGVPLLVEGETGALTATTYRRTAPDEAFRLPARPRDPTPSTTTR